MKCRIRTKTYICGNYKHVYLYPVLSTGCRGRRKRYKPTSEVQATVNARHAEKRLEMLLESNFKEDDWFFTLTYRPYCRPKSDDEALKKVKNFIRRLKYHCKKNGLSEPVAIWTTELTQKNHYYHHHMALKCSLPDKKIKEIWGNGIANGFRIQLESYGLVGLSKYFSKEPIGKVKYHSTRNLKKPIEQKNDSTSQKEFNMIFEEAYFHRTDELEKRYPDYFVNDNSLMAYESFTGARFVYIKLYRKNKKYRS